jgi:hypothetical protein
MPDEFPLEPLKTAWQSQPVEPMMIAIDELRPKLKEFERRIRRRNFREYAAGAVLIVWSVWKTLASHTPFDRLVYALFGLAALYVIYQLSKRGSVRREPAQGENCLEFYRTELARQKDLLDGIWRWYLGPLCLPVIVLLTGATIAKPAVFPLILATASFTALIFLGIWWLNAHAARKLQQQIDALDALRQ